MDDGFNVDKDRREEEYAESSDAFTGATSNSAGFRAPSLVATSWRNDLESAPYQSSNMEGYNMEVDDPAFDPNIDPLLQNIAANPGDQHLSQPESPLDSTNILEDLDLNDLRDAMGEFRRASDQSSYVERSPMLRSRGEQDAEATCSTSNPGAQQCDHPGCSFSTGTERNLNRHKKRMHGKPEFFCPSCSYNSTRSDYVTEHKKSHTPKGIKCLRKKLRGNHSDTEI